MADSQAYVGGRRSYSGALCTVRYYGPLDGTKGDWLGVEWDDPSRGKHAGQHEGKQVFTCLSSSSTAASFIRPTRPPDPERTVLQAILFKYAPRSHRVSQDTEHAVNAPNQSQDGYGPVEISGKIVEEVGFERIERQLAELGHLRIVVLNDLVVTGIANRTTSDVEVKRAKEQLRQSCPRITELDIGWNPFETWFEIGHLSEAIPQLRVLRASGLRLNESCPHPANMAFSNLHELYLNECLLTWPQIFSLVLGTEASPFPVLKLLSLANNDLSTLTDHDTRSPLPSTQIPSLETLILDNNELEDLRVLSYLIKIFPALVNVSLQKNKIVQICASELTSANDLKRIKTLNLSRNSFSSWTAVDDLSTVFPNLTSLRISRNPVYEQSADMDPSSHRTPSDSSYFLTLARMPSLKSLNYSNTTAQDRQEGEIYYLSVAEKRFAQLLKGSQDEGQLAQAKAEYRLYDKLCAKYDRPSIFAQAPVISTTTSQSTTHTAGTLGSRLISVTFHHQLENQSYNRLIPSTISVYGLKALVARRFSLPPLQFRLVYESTELDPIREAISSTNWDEWGDWDADEVNDVHNDTEAERWTNGVMLKDGKRWQTREVEILNGMRPWGDVLEMDVKEAKIRIEPFVWKTFEMRTDRRPP